MTQPLDIWVKLKQKQITDRMILIPDGNDIVEMPLSKHGTFYRPGLFIGDEEIVGVQMLPNDIAALREVTGEDSLWDALLELDSLDLAGFYICRRDEPEIFFDKFPHLAGAFVDDDGNVVKNFAGWNGVMQ